MLTFRLRTFMALLGFLAFTLIYVTVGLRWHTHRARAAVHARQEVEHTFEAANLARAAVALGSTDESHARALRFRKLAELHEQAARENARLREVYENAW